MKRPNCFVSYYHKDDQKYVGILRNIYKRISISDTSLKGDISHKSEERIYERVKFNLKHSTVLIVLVGKNTANRKWIDWEIWAALEPFRHRAIEYRDGFRPCGILAIFLPGTKNHSIPKRLQDNIDSGYVVCMEWESLNRNRNFIRKLFIAERMREKTFLINNKRKRAKRNKIHLLGIKI